MAQIRLDSKAFCHNLNAIAQTLKNNIDSIPNSTKQLPKSTPKSTAESTLESLAKSSHKSTPEPTTKSILPQIALVMKDNAYGHGLLQIAQLAKENDIDCVFVKNYDEALALQGIFSHITILYGEAPLDCPSNIYRSIASLESLKKLEKDLQDFPKKNCKSLPLGIELKCNIGMNRNGIQKSDLDKAFEILARLIREGEIRLIGVFAHNGYGDNGGEEALDFAKSQANFYEIKRQVGDFCNTLQIPLPRFHSLSTTGALRNKTQKSSLEKLELELCDTIVRIGIGAYGYHTAEIPLEIHLKPVLSLWASKIATQHLRKGDKIGYGGVSVVGKDSAFSTYDVGYGDGLFRLGKDMPKLHCASGEEILPVMSMDCFSCESEREEICVFSDVGEFARVFGTIPYVILTHLSPFIPRVITR